MTETLIVAMIVMGAVLYIGRDVARKLRTARTKRDQACGGDCGCSQ
ncbi:MAG: FeoB-associated Cys-rich membrane protein [Gemmatimonadota bacterium]|jgi:hypothetical protein|nr:FeoB-associated Cys-rich membrane protein [Gemmatimonadota bacterium]